MYFSDFCFEKRFIHVLSEGQSQFYKTTSVANFLNLINKFKMFQEYLQVSDTGNGCSIGNALVIYAFITVIVSWQVFQFVSLLPNLTPDQHVWGGFKPSKLFIFSLYCCYGLGGRSVFRGSKSQSFTPSWNFGRTNQSVFNYRQQFYL